MFQVISDIMVDWYDKRNTIVFAINLCNVYKMIRSLMIIISNHYGIKWISNLIQLEPCNVMFQVISDIMVDWCDKRNTIDHAINFCNS